MESSRKIRSALISGVVAFVLVIVGVSVGIMIRDNIYSATLDFLVAPKDSEIMMNGEAVKASEKKVKPGEYEIIISREGFETETRLVVLEKGNTERIFVALTPNDPSTMDWYDTHQEDAIIADGVVGQEYTEASIEMAEKYDILSDLPVHKYSYILGYGDCSSDGGPDFCVVIRAGFGFRDEAVNYLQNTGKDIAKYYVEIEDYSSPFTKVTINVPDGLTFDSEADSWLNSQVLETDSVDMTNVIKNRISQLDSIYDMAKVSEVKCFGGGNYCGVKVAVYDEEKYSNAEVDGEIDPDDTLHDTYRMIMAKIDGTWRVVSDLKFLLNYEDNLKLPREIVRLANEF